MKPRTVKRRRWWPWALGFCVLAGCSGSYSSGDRVLVAKFLYETHLGEPNRFDVVVFKYPDAPVKNGVARNYIKRLLGLPGEIILILFGQLFRMPEPEPGVPPHFDDVTGVPPEKLDQHLKDLWERRFSQSAEKQRKSEEWFQQGKFEPVRKPPRVMMAMRRIVHDNDYPAKDLIGKAPPRWAPVDEAAWQANTSNGFQHAKDAAHMDWLRYRHLVIPRKEPPRGEVLVKGPRLITDLMAYNTFYEERGGHETPSQSWVSLAGVTLENWVGDLMLECDVTVTEPKGAFVLELSRGIHRYQARFDLSSGKCTLVQLGPEGEKELATQTTTVNRPGTHQLRFANFDARLTLWVNGNLPFQDGHDYVPPELPRPEEAKLDPQQFLAALSKRCGPTKNDLEPASIGAKGAAVEVNHLRLWRDTHYTYGTDGEDTAAVDWHDPNTWEALKLPKRLNEQRKVEDMLGRALYVQPKHYLVLGDNSPASSDSRTWGLVPERLMLGRALMVYFPFDRFGPIR